MLLKWLVCEKRKEVRKGKTLSETFCQFLTPQMLGKNINTSLFFMALHLPFLFADLLNDRQ